MLAARICSLINGAQAMHGAKGLGAGAAACRTLGARAVEHFSGGITEHAWPCRPNAQGITAAALVHPTLISCCIGVALQMSPMLRNATEQARPCRSNAHAAMGHWETRIKTQKTLP